MKKIWLPSLCICLILATSWRWQVLSCHEPEIIDPVTPASDDQDMLDTLDLILNDEDNMPSMLKMAMDKRDPSGLMALSTLDLPPWTRFSTGDVADILQATKNLSEDVAIVTDHAPTTPVATSPSFPQPQMHENVVLPDSLAIEPETNAIELELMEDPADEDVFPMVYAGFVKRDGALLALIMDRRTGTSYFRQSGESLARYMVSEVTLEAIILLDSKTQRRIRLLVGEPF